MPGKQNRWYCPGVGYDWILYTWVGRLKGGAGRPERWKLRCSPIECTVVVAVVWIYTLWRRRKKIYRMWTCIMLVRAKFRYFSSSCLPRFGVRTAACGRSLTKKIRKKYEKKRGGTITAVNAGRRQFDLKVTKNKKKCENYIVFFKDTTIVQCGSLLPIKQYNVNWLIINLDIGTFFILHNI